VVRAAVGEFSLKLARRRIRQVTREKYKFRTVVTATICCDERAPQPRHTGCPHERHFLDDAVHCHSIRSCRRDLAYPNADITQSLRSERMIAALPELDPARVSRFVPADAMI
jgi:hypothetical protein